MPVRIYDIAKKLGIESKEVLAKAKELGITAAKVPSSSSIRSPRSISRSNWAACLPSRPDPAALGARARGRSHGSSEPPPVAVDEPLAAVPEPPPCTRASCSRRTGAAEEVATPSQMPSEVETAPGKPGGTGTDPVACG